MKRTFIAIPVSQETCLQVEAIKQTIPELRENVRLVPTNNLHLTLKFLGDTDEKAIPDISKALDSVITTIDRFEYICEGLGCFPNNRKPRVLWLGIGQGFEQIQKLSQAIESVLGKFGYQPEKREFKPHLTIGRVKNPLKKVAGLESFLNYEINPTINPVENVIFYESNLTAGGPIYTRLAVFNLK
ncbi:MAG TPA: RNA 2',3'-cyclic phosphodiesterase [Candidatus Marinimicrobia bacterium]|nr:RNA 2',3'-cyclic phosphodiesterase [Candidatus Neomarinimicrobiota bacterium]HRS51278.1 RNA 2',3'-cyclic phosphodiesterase [Candidatus Neomarinimicrobiota bacterium]HRU91484.1 RNA 2',3'-cyclic phosphodiesterase [Candidatus Neomarinimicrobiota bacterium]